MTKKNAKQRIFDGAVALFAHKGFAAVRIRQIAQKARVNIALINYYYGGKVGVLRAIINESYDKFYRAITGVGAKNLPQEERIRCLVQNLIEFFRENRELAMVGLNALPIDIPEILDLKMRWIIEYRTRLNKFFTQIGLDTNDTMQMSFIRGLLCAILSSHFNWRFIYEHIMQARTQPQYRRKKVTPEATLEYDDAYYENFAEMLVTFYVNGLSGLLTKRQKRVTPPR